MLLISTRLWATWSLTQVKGNGSCAGNNSTCSVTVTSTGSGHVLFVGVIVPRTATITSASGGGTYTLCGTTCRNGNTTTGFTDGAYVLSSTSGVTSISATVSTTFGGGSTWVTFVLELSTDSGPALFDTSNNNLVTTNCTSCTGTALTLGGTNDAIVTWASCGGTCSGITTYTNDLANPSGDGVAHLLNTASGTAPNWSQSPSSNLTSAAIAFKETSAPASQPCYLSLLGVGVC